MSNEAAGDQSSRAMPSSIEPIAGLNKDASSDSRPGPVDWSSIAQSSAFRTLMADKRRFAVPAVIFFVAYYFALPILVGYAPDLMKTRVWGYVNLAYVFALSQFVMAWTMAWLYTRSARRLDVKRDQIVHNLQEASNKVR